ncbi:hypothetical protein C7M84_003729 [Penaeus vannamei]|uniref:Uncharacterized protein n=1 Tax=Penaeus vannamei TaxID=6689 RepID=A0A3R7N589_PENVA|nr:hypothetical protein C7M84_003729 [Penaeus vannamei]
MMSRRYFNRSRLGQDRSVDCGRERETECVTKEPENSGRGKEPSPIDPRCAAPFGNFPDATTCERYVSCWGGRGFSQRCGTNLVFNPVSRSCQAGTSCPGVSSGAPDSGQKLRLANGRGPWTGQLQVKYANSWAFVDARGWSHALGQLVCRQLGFIGYEGGQGIVPVTRGSSELLQLGCPSGASSIRQCNLTPCSSCPDDTKVVSIRCKEASSSRCPPSDQGRVWQRWKESCYLVLDNYRAPRDAGRTLCRDRGGELVSVESQDEHNYVSELLSRSGDHVEFYTDAGDVSVGGLKTWVSYIIDVHILYANPLFLNPSHPPPPTHSSQPSPPLPPPNCLLPSLLSPHPSFLLLPTLNPYTNSHPLPLPSLLLPPIHHTGSTNSPPSPFLHPTSTPPLTLPLPLPSSLLPPYPTITPLPPHPYPSPLPPPFPPTHIPSPSPHSFFNRLEHHNPSPHARPAHLSLLRDPEEVLPAGAHDELPVRQRFLLLQRRRL